MNSLRHLLLVVVLLVAQLAAGAHAVGHAADNKDQGLPNHVCELCLAAHDLGVALPSVAVLPAVDMPRWAPNWLDTHDRAAFPPPAAMQRGPPLA